MCESSTITKLLGLDVGADVVVVMAYDVDDAELLKLASDRRLVDTVMGWLCTEAAATPGRRRARPPRRML